MQLGDVSAWLQTGMFLGVLLRILYNDVFRRIMKRPGKCAST